MGPILDEVVGPDMVGPLCPEANARAVVQPKSAALIATPLTSMIVGPQTLSRGRSAVTLQWKGQAERLRVLDARGQERAWARAIGVRSMTIGVPPDLKAGRIVLQGLKADEALSWRFIRAPRTPEPDWMIPQAEKEDDLIWALWLMNEAPATWRLEGVSMLGRLEASDFSARQILDGARAGALPAAPP